MGAQRDLDRRDGPGACGPRAHRQTRSIAIDATSGAGGLPVDIGDADVYYFAPQKSFASDGGLWIALLSPAALERIARARTPPTAGSRSSSRCSTALENSRQGPDLQHARGRDAVPARRPDRAGCSRPAAWTGCVARTRASSQHLYGWAERTSYATPFVAEPAKPLAGRRHDRLRRRRRRGRGRDDAAGERDRRRRAVPQARPQPAAGRHVPGGRHRRRAGADGLHRRSSWSGSAMNARREGARQGEDRRLWRRAAAKSTSTSTSASTGTTRELASRIGEYDGILIRSATKITAELIERAERLKVIGRAGVGVDNVDVPAATKRGIVVANAPESNVVTAAEHTMALLLSLARNIPQRARVADERASGSARSSPASSSTRRRSASSASGGSASSWPSAPAASACGCSRSTRSSAPSATGSSASRRPMGPMTSTRRPTSSRSTCRRRRRPKGFLNDETFAKMRDGVRVLNVARGGLIDEEALERRARLRQGRGRRARRVPDRADDRESAVRRPETSSSRPTSAPRPPRRPTAPATRAPSRSSPRSAAASSRPPSTSPRSGPRTWRCSGRSCRWRPSSDASR